MDVPAQVLGAAAVAGHMDEPEPEPVRGPVSHHRPAHHRASVSHRRQVERALASELTATTARRSLLLSVRASLTPNRSDASATNCGTPQRGLRWRPGADKRDGALPCWTGGQFGFQDPVRGRRRGGCCAHLGGSETSSLVRASTKHASIVGCTRYSTATSGTYLSTRAHSSWTVLYCTVQHRSTARRALCSATAASPTRRVRQGSPLVGSGKRPGVCRASQSGETAQSRRRLSEPAGGMGMDG